MNFIILYLKLAAAIIVPISVGIWLTYCGIWYLIAGLVVVLVCTILAPSFIDYRLKRGGDPLGSDVAMAIFLGILYILVITSKETRDLKVIERAPGSQFQSFALRFISKKLFEKYFGQTIADAQEEIFAALAAGDQREAKMIERELKLSLIRVIVAGILTLPAAAIAKVVKLVLGYK